MKREFHVRFWEGLGCNPRAYSSAARRRRKDVPCRITIGIHMKAAMGVRLSDEALKIIEEESRKQGVTKTAVIEMALRLYAKRRTK